MGELGFNRALLSYDAGSHPDPAAPEIPRRLIGITPWAASGPGWSSSGLTLLWEAAGVTSQVTVYREDLRGDAAVLFPHFLAMYQELLVEVLAERHVAEGARP